MPSPTGHAASLPYTNGRLSPPAVHLTSADILPQQNHAHLSDTEEPATLDPVSDADAPGEDYDEDEDMAEASDSSDDVDAEGEPDGDYDSESPPSEQAGSDRAASSMSRDSSRQLKRKASAEKDDYMAQNPELYGLRRSVRRHRISIAHALTPSQGRARPSRRIVSLHESMKGLVTDRFQVDSSDEDDDSGSDQPRKRQRTTSRKGLLTQPHIVFSILTQQYSLAPSNSRISVSRLGLGVGWLRWCPSQHPDQEGTSTSTSRSRRPSTPIASRGPLLCTSRSPSHQL